MKTFLIADIGGTHSRLALVKKQNNIFRIINRKKVKSNNFKSISDLLSSYLEKEKVSKIVIAAAGKAEKDKICMTQGPFIITKREIEKVTNCKEIVFFNDMSAHTYYSLYAKFEKKVILNNGSKKKGSLLIIAPGTGLGVSIAIMEDKKHIIRESEAGHMKASFETEEINFKKYLIKKNRTKNIEFENLLSGKGFAQSFNFSHNTNLDPFEVLAQKKAKLKTTTKNYYKFLARFSREMSLVALPQKIIFMGGMVKYTSCPSKKEFLKEFTNNNKFREYLKSIEIVVVQDADTGLKGLKEYLKLKS